MAQLGFVGLGKMGGRVAKRLLDAGHTVTGYNRTQSKARWLLDAGMQRGASPRQVAEVADVTFSMVTNTAALHELLNGDDGILADLAPGKVYIDMSTISVGTSREIAERVAAKGAVLATCGIRRPELACENTSCCLLLLAGSSEEAYNRKHASAHLYQGGMDTVQRILTFITRLTRFCLQSLHRYVTWTTPSPTSLL
jgi:3-hydroxyisobutyrate dehydrogenase-like beta-hydroxyacid dehydrogenase